MYMFKQCNICYCVITVFVIMLIYLNLFYLTLPQIIFRDSNKKYQVTIKRVSLQFANIILTTFSNPYSLISPKGWLIFSSQVKKEDSNYVGFEFSLRDMQEDFQGSISIFEKFYLVQLNQMCILIKNRKCNNERLKSTMSQLNSTSFIH